MRPVAMRPVPMRPVSPPEMIELSLNEAEMLALKAARGAGLPWGLAEDVGRAVRWLAPRSAAWAGSLFALLDGPPADLCCPFRLGGFMTDTAALPIDRTFPRVSWPIWLVPALHETARLGRCAVAARLGATDLRCPAGGDVVAAVPWSALEALPEADVRVRAPAAEGAVLPHALVPLSTRPLIAAQLLARLETLAARTYVPASEESRRKGAGAGLRDED